MARTCHLASVETSAKKGVVPRPAPAKANHGPARILSLDALASRFVPADRRPNACVQMATASYAGIITYSKDSGGVVEHWAAAAARAFGLHLRWLKRPRGGEKATLMKKGDGGQGG
jgi:hypothetical protein